MVVVAVTVMAIVVMVVVVTIMMPVTPVNEIGMVVGRAKVYPLLCAGNLFYDRHGDWLGWSVSRRRRRRMGNKLGERVG